MSIFKCKMCGGDLNIIGAEKVVECEYCGSKQTIPVANDEKRVNLYNRANRLRMSCEFDKAASIYEQIIAEFSEEAEAYFCLCLCHYGIEYVDDPATAKKIPTCHRASFEKMRKDENYELALENADMDARIVYEDQAKEIDRIMGDILSLSKSEEPYDIFICYKETDNSGARTPDSVLAQDIHDALTEKGYRVFFSRITLEDKLGTQYEPYIFAALNSAKIMLVVGTDYEYLNSVWVKNEWSRFLKIVAQDKTKMLIPCYKDMDPYDMPNEFKGLQSQDCSKLGFMQDLIRGIDKIFGRNANTKVVEKVVVQDSIQHASTEPLLERVFLFLEDGKWKDADIYCEKVLDIDPKNADAYLGKLMAELQVKKRKDLADCEEPFDDRDNYSKVLRFANEKLEAEMRGYIEHINERNENERLEAERRKLAEENRINETVESIAKTLQNRQILNEIILLQEQLTAQIDKKEKLNQLICDFDSIRDSLNSLNQQVTDLKKRVAELQEKRDSLGLFAGKQRKDIETEIQNLFLQIDDYKERVKATSNTLCGFHSKNEIEVTLSESVRKIQSLQTELSDKEESNSNILSIEQIEQALRDERVNQVFRTKYPVLCQLLNSLLFVEVGKTCFFGNIPQTADGKDQTPIEWRVLAKENNKMLVLSEYALDCKPYNTSYTSVTWETCSLRTWLNETFYNAAFDTMQKAMIQKTTVSADKNPDYSTNPGNATSDNVFLLSIAEVNKYFSSDEARKCVPTAYAIAQGVYESDDYTVGCKGTCWWWLRSPGNDQDYAALAFSDGSVSCTGRNVNYDDIAVRPALWINLES